MKWENDDMDVGNGVLLSQGWWLHEALKSQQYSLANKINFSFSERISICNSSF